MSNITIIDVANYILDKMGELTTMKLQKLTYYCQAWSLAWDEKPLFDDDFEAWANGPVSRRLYDKHKGDFIVKKPYDDNYKNLFSEEQIDTMDKVLEFYGKKEPLWLSELTHQELPWIEARRNANAKVGERCDEVISKETMQEYYGGL